MPALLAGVRVIDLGQYIPGPYAALILADMGAEVVKVEPPSGDPMRRLGPAGPGGASIGYRTLNGGKSVLRLDLKSADGRRIFERLIAAADVLVESYRPGVLDRLGFTAQRLRELAPALVHVAVSGWGQTGPYRERAGHDIGYMAVGGGLALSGTGSEPTFAFPPTSDYASGQQAAIAALGALVRRGRTGEGARIDISIMETVLAWQAVSLAEAAAGDPPERRAALLNGGAACYRIYRTSDDRFLALGAIEGRFWADFCQAVERPDWVARQWEPMPQDTLIADVAGVVRRKTLGEWQGILTEVDACAEPLLNLGEIGGHPQIAARGLVRRDADGVVTVASPLRVDGLPPPDRQPPVEVDATAILAAWTGCGTAS